MTQSIAYKHFPRKAKKAIKRSFMKTIYKAWKPHKVYIKSLCKAQFRDRPDYKSWIVNAYELR